jgi:hypothetical protein
VHFGKHCEASNPIMFDVAPSEIPTDTRARFKALDLSEHGVIRCGYCSTTSAARNADAKRVAVAWEVNGQIAWFPRGSYGTTDAS